MYDAYGPGKYDLPDQGYIAKVHPLDLWLLGYLLKNPGSTLTEMVNASRFERRGGLRLAVQEPPSGRP